MASAGSDWATSGFTQLRWMMSYIGSVYGDPAHALFVLAGEVSALVRYRRMASARSVACYERDGTAGTNF